MHDRPTYEHMTTEHLGNGADQVDLALFLAACRHYQRHTGRNDEETTQWVLSNGDWWAKAQAMLGHPSYEAARAAVVLWP